MKHQRSWWLLLHVILCICANVRAQTAENKTLPANADGAKAAQYLWDTILTRCGDTWRYRGSKLKLVWFEEQLGPGLWEYKGVTFKLTPRPVSKVDALNGVSWKGVASMNATAWRHSFGGKWEDPKDPSNLSRNNKVVVEKVNGTWLYRSGSFGGFSEDDDSQMVEHAQATAAELASTHKPSCDAVGGTKR
jgi:hypothetical protein